MRHLAAAEAERDFNLVAVFEELVHLFHLHIVGFLLHLLIWWYPNPSGEHLRHRALALGGRGYRRRDDSHQRPGDLLARRVRVNAVLRLRRAALHH